MGPSTRIQRRTRGAKVTPASATGASAIGARALGASAMDRWPSAPAQSERWRSGGSL